MSKALYRLINGLIGAAAAAGEAIVVYAGTKGFTYSVQIATAIPIAVTAINQILLLFVKDPTVEKKAKK